MTNACKGLDSRFNIKVNRANAYVLGYRRCSRCVMYVEGSYLICPCCKVKTRGRAR